MITLNGLTFTYQYNPHYTAPIIDNLSATLDQPLTVLSGPNGSGKTTLLLLLAGLLKPNSGSVTIDGIEASSSNLRQHIGISASKVNLPDFLMVSELLTFHASQFNCSIPNKLIERLRLSSFLSTQIAKLSLGNYKKVSLLTAMMHQPKVLLLDEPTNGLDDASRAELIDVIRSYQGQVVMASHEPIAEHFGNAQQLAFG